MFVNPFLRQVIGAFLCGAAALSLTSMMLPSVMAVSGLTDAFWARLLLSEYAAHAVLVWAVAGWWIARKGRMQTGGLLLAAVGLACGVFAGTLVDAAPVMALALTGACGGFYGLTVGLLIGRLLEEPAQAS